MPSYHIINTFHLSQWGKTKIVMSNKVNEQVERKGNLIDNVPTPKKKEQIDGKKAIPNGKQLLIEKGGKQ